MTGPEPEPEVEVLDTAAAGAPQLDEDDDEDLTDDDAPAVDPAEQSPPAPEAGAQDAG